MALCMTAHIGVDAMTGLMHVVVASKSKLVVVIMAEQLVRASAKRVHPGAGYIGVGKRLGEVLGEEKDVEDSRCFLAANRRGIRNDEMMKKSAMKKNRCSRSEEPRQASAQCRAPVPGYRELP